MTKTTEDDGSDADLDLFDPRNAPDYDSVIRKAIDQNDVDRLLRMANPEPCGCIGVRYGEKHCRCVMWSREVRRRVSVYALMKQGRIVVCPEKDINS